MQVFPSQAARSLEFLVPVWQERGCLWLVLQSQGQGFLQPGFPWRGRLVFQERPQGLPVWLVFLALQRERLLLVRLELQLGLPRRVEPPGLWRRPLKSG